MPTNNGSKLFEDIMFWTDDSNWASLNKNEPAEFPCTLSDLSEGGKIFWTDDANWASLNKNEPNKSLLNLQLEFASTIRV